MDLLTPELGLFLWTLVAFLIVFVILKKFAWKPILKSLAEREHGIADSIASADRLRLEMAGMQAENEKLMATAREERTAMLREAKDAGDKMIADAKESAKNQAAKIMAETQQQIENQKMAAITDIKNQIGNLAVEVAEKVIRRNLSNDAAQTDYTKSLVQEITLN